MKYDGVKVCQFINYGVHSSGVVECRHCVFYRLFVLVKFFLHFPATGRNICSEQLIKQIGNLSNNRTGGLLRVILGGGSFWFKFPFKILFRACGKSSVQFPDNIPTFRHVNEYAVAIGKRKYCFAVRCAGRYNGSPSGKPQHVVRIVPAKLDCVNL